MKWLGVDVSKDTLDCKIEGIEGVKSFRNTVVGFKKLRDWIASHEVSNVVLEATGGYERKAFVYLWATDVPVSLINPRQTRAFAHSMGRRAKNDYLDAEVITEYGVRMEPIPNEPLTDAVLELRTLLTRRSQLVKMMVSEKNRAKAPNSSPFTKNSARALMNTLRNQLANADDELKHIIEANEELDKKARKLEKLTGVGPVLMTTLLADMPELGKLERNQASALAGVAPYDRDSGTLKGKRAIAGGRVRVRCALYMATIAGIRHNPVLKEFYQRLLANGKPRKVAIVACMRKFIIYINGILKDNPEQHFMAASS